MVGKIDNKDNPGSRGPAHLVVNGAIDVGGGEGRVGVEWIVSG